MINDRNVKQLIYERASLDPNDPIVEKYWVKLTELLSVDEEATKQFLENCSSDEVYWISEIFEDIVYKFQSRKFICFLKELQHKFPDIDLTVDINSAEEMIE